MRIAKTEFPEVKQHLGNFIQKYKTVFWLDSCNLPNAFNIGNYELVIGLGEKAKIELLHNDFEWSRLEKFTSGDDWKFFALSYDLKNKIADLNTQNKDVLDWPLISCVIPEVVVTLTKQGVLETHGLTLAEVMEDTEDTSKDASLSFTTIQASLSKEEHNRRVIDIKKEIANGNMYEMNLCMEYVLANFYCNQPFRVFQKLVQLSPTPFAAYVQVDGKYVLSASPERFLATQNNRVYSQPIKGTSKRFEDYHKNQESRLHLANSIKERAEHIMIVDLVRNDLSKLSKPGSLRVDELFEIYGYRQVNQMISTISGLLENSSNFIEAIKATYPMGSMTGAPKHIVMKFIDNLETAARGWYSGTVGYIQPNGNFDSNVVIRSLLFDSNKNLAKYSVGGAITFDSDPNMEYEECLLKSEAIRSVLDVKD